MAEAVPLYGTCPSSILARLRNCSTFIWLEEPVPPDAKLIAPGRLRASVIRSFTFFTGSAGCTTSTTVPAATVEIGSKSEMGSNGSDFCSDGLITCDGEMNSNV